MCVHLIRSNAAWKEIKRMALIPEVAEVLTQLKELRTGELRPIVRRRSMRWDGWVRPQFKFWKLD